MLVTMNKSTAYSIVKTRNLYWLLSITKHIFHVCLLETWYYYLLRDTSSNKKKIHNMALILRFMCSHKNSRCSTFENKLLAVAGWWSSGLCFTLIFPLLNWRNVFSKLSGAFIFFWRLNWGNCVTLSMSCCGGNIRVQYL